MGRLAVQGSVGAEGSQHIPEEERLLSLRGNHICKGKPLLLLGLVSQTSKVSR